MTDAPLVTDAWNPTQYDRFAAERRMPFDDLLAMVAPVPGGRVIDLGCGTGELTVELHRWTSAATTLGVDSSASMLEHTGALAGPGLTFTLGDLRAVGSAEPFDVVFSNAALQWVGDHPALLASITELVAANGQLAFQVPSNADHLSHLLSAEVASEEPFASAMGGDPPSDPVRGVLKPEEYAQVLFELGYVDQRVRLAVYGHVLDSTNDVVEWTKGTSLTRFKAKLSPELYDEFVDRYRARLLATIGDRSPYFYAFKRVLVWARRP